ncbi:hypothetical protein T12_15320 [Trichinella patagoniensis]|uniref:Uncharacterized protein n=1 Tax=Trichinella patagoniensis TaxID=990121 RepID=A0A0V0ZD16_9BILA|nr:hypothetical protein T12_15320 [Trichinella patagoniensis]
MWEYDRWRTVECDEEASGRCVFVTVSVRCCVIVLCVRVVFDLCTSVFIDNRSPSLNNAGVHCFVLHCYTFVNERRSSADVFAMVEEVSLMEEIIWAADALQTEVELNLEGEERQFAIDDWATCRQRYRVGRSRVPGSRRPENALGASTAAVLEGHLSGPETGGCRRESVGIFHSFWAQFKAGIHNRSELDDTTKFTYLISITEGTARSAIERIPHTLKNYSQAVDILKTRFGRPRLAIREHVAALWRASACRKMTAQGIQSLVDEVTKHLHWLTALDRDSFAGRLSGLGQEHRRPCLPSQPEKTRNHRQKGRSIERPRRNSRVPSECTECKGDRITSSAAALAVIALGASRSVVGSMKQPQNGHWARECRGGRHCGVDGCHQPHHRLLHPPSTKESVQSPGSDCAYQSPLAARSTPGVRPCSRLRAGRKPRGEVLRPHERFSFMILRGHVGPERRWMRVEFQFGVVGGSAGFKAVSECSRKGMNGTSAGSQSAEADVVSSASCRLAGIGRRAEVSGLIGPYNGTTLNSQLEVGPNLQIDLLRAILCFRRLCVRLQADIKKMYLQILVRKEDQDACRFLREPDALRAIPVEKTAKGTGGRSWKTLGIYWEREDDHVTFVAPEKTHPEGGDTKRQMLSAASCIFDPIEEVEWHWVIWKRELVDLSFVKFPCALVPVPLEQAKRIELHALCDASEQAYGAPREDVTPVKRLSLPRLELMGALRALRLIRKSRWRGCGRRQVAGSRCVEEIQQLVEPACWRHYPGRSSFADVLSRGASLKKLAVNSCYWQGPKWLSGLTEAWTRRRGSSERSSPLPPKEDRTPHEALLVSVVAYSTVDFFHHERYSDIEKLFRISALCLRFVSNCRSSPGDRRSGPLMVRELDATEQVWVWIAQRQVFRREIDALRANGCVDAQSCLRQLSPYLDEVGTLQVRGRLEKSNLPLSEKHPAILLKEHEVTQGLICRCHLRQLHAWVYPMQITLRQRYWIPHGRSRVRRVIRGCLQCRWATAQPLQLRMAALPEDQTNPAPAFAHVGMDFTGPLFVRCTWSSSRRCRRSVHCMLSGVSWPGDHADRQLLLLPERRVGTVSAVAGDQRRPGPERFGWTKNPVEVYPTKSAIDGRLLGASRPDHEGVSSEGSRAGAARRRAAPDRPVCGRRMPQRPASDTRGRSN